jgi:pimeloyl-ACP methyl ester carboxylesterase
VTTFVCLHGAAGWGEHWRLVAEQLERRGHAVIAPDLPCEEPVGLDAYADAVVAAMGEPRRPVVLVAQSLAGFVAPLVCTRVPVDAMVLVAAMVPAPGERGLDWWTVTGHEAAVAAQGLPDDSEETLFTHDVPADVLASFPPSRGQTGELLEEPWPLEAWPDVPTRFIACRDDRFFPVDWLRRVVVERLGIEPTEVPGGHCAYFSEPEALAEAIVEVSRSA